MSDRQKKIGSLLRRVRERVNRPKQALREFRRLLGACAAFQLQKIPAACDTGCSSCCYTIPWTWMESERTLIDLSLKNDTRIRARVLGRAGLIMKEWVRLRSTYGLKANENESDSFPAAWEELMIPCPLLEDGRCLIYESRPLECRLTFGIEPCEIPRKMVTPILPELIYTIEDEDAENPSLDNLEKIVSISDILCEVGELGEHALVARFIPPHPDTWRDQAISEVLLAIGQVDKWLYEKKHLTPKPLIHVLLKMS